MHLRFVSTVRRMSPGALLPPRTCLHACHQVGAQALTSKEATQYRRVADRMDSLLFRAHKAIINGLLSVTASPCGEFISDKFRYNPVFLPQSCSDARLSLERCAVTPSPLQPVNISGLKRAHTGLQTVGVLLLLLLFWGGSVTNLLSILRVLI